MDTLNILRNAVQHILIECAEYGKPPEGMKFETVFDTENDHYLWLILGWDGNRRIYNCLIHLDIIDEQIWVQQNNTEFTLIEDFERFGISKYNIVNGMIHANRRRMLENVV
ncbi:MAG: XisI protein [Rhodothermia bacterium]|nr:XisI protein [Rhodothermia bacterium]